jgi:DNA-binding CsgD family transcriptional regulator
VDGRVARWLGVVAELMVQRGPFPYERLSQELAVTFDVETVSWNWRRSDQTLGFVLTPALPDFVTADSQELWVDIGLVRHHPLVRWFATTQDPTPQTMGRVPSGLSSGPLQEEVRSILRSVGCEEQLSIPCALSGDAYRAFVLCRTGRDFDDDDLAVASRLGAAFAALDAQADILSRWPPCNQTTASAPELTGRETAVLRLLCSGHTSHAIAHRLGCTARTVEKHLQHIYRKLEVNDRLGAVKRAAELNITERLHGTCLDEAPWSLDQRDAAQR